MAYVSNTTETDILLPAGTLFTIRRGMKHYMYLPKSMGQVVPGTTLQDQAKNPLILRLMQYRLNS